MAPKPRVLYWFRTDLRLHDSPGLKAAIDLNPECLYPIWTWDPHYVYHARVGPNRWQFLLDCQQDVSNSLTKLNPKSKLFVIREAPQTVLPKIFKSWKISHLVFEKDTDGYGRARDREIEGMAKKAGVKIIMEQGRTLYDSDELVKHNWGKPTMSISQVEHAAKAMGPPSRPVEAPTSLPDPGDTTLDFSPDKPSPNPDFNSIQRSGNENSYAKLAGPKGDFSVPEYQELGLKPATSNIRGGETRALEELDRIISDEVYTATFSKPETAPTALKASTTRLSPHHHFGSLSTRLFYWKVQDLLSRYKTSKDHPAPSTLPTNLIGQLLFRDMYFGAQAQLGDKFSQTLHNSHARFVPWHLPSTHNPKTGLSDGSYTIDSSVHETYFQRWRMGLTGFPWIDALMRQLRLEGWIHHLGRHAVACFLTRGGCYIDWERGASVFEEWLVDHEVACNAGNWQWLSCVAFYGQFYRCYSPIAFPKKTDKNGDFVRKYVPELKDFPAKYIYEPHKAPIQDQKKAGCMIKGDHTEASYDFYKTFNVEGAAHEDGITHQYPKPMFDFPTQREICIDGMKNAYHIGLYGNDPKVIDGSWKTLFEDSAEGPTTDSSLKNKPTKSVNAVDEEVGEDKDDHTLAGEALHKHAPSPKDRPKGKSQAVSEDEGEADEVGGENKGGDNEGRGKRKRGQGPGQGTLDGHFGSPDRGGKKRAAGRR